MEEVTASRLCSRSRLSSSPNQSYEYEFEFEFKNKLKFNISSSPKSGFKFEDPLWLLSLLPHSTFLSGFAKYTITITIKVYIYTYTYKGIYIE